MKYLLKATIFCVVVAGFSLVTPSAYAWNTCKKCATATSITVTCDPPESQNCTTCTTTTQYCADCGQNQCHYPDATQVICYYNYNTGQCILSGDPCYWT